MKNTIAPATVSLNFGRTVSPAIDLYPFCLHVVAGANTQSVFGPVPQYNSALFHADPTGGAGIVIVSFCHCPAVTVNWTP